MKIIYLLPDLGFASEKGQGGQVSHALGIAKGLKKNNIDITVIGEKNLSKYFNNNNLNIIQIDNYNTFRICSRIYFSYKVIKFALHNEYDVLLIRKNIYVLLLSIITYRFKLISNPKRLNWEVNGLTFHNYRNKKFGRIFYFLIVLIHKIILRSSEGIYVVSEYLKKELTTGLFAIDSSNIVVIPNGAPEWIGPNVHTYSVNTVKFVYFGVFQPYNDFKTLISAFKKVKDYNNNSDVELHFCGYGLEEEIIKKASECNDSIYFWGPQKLTSLYAKGIASSKSVGVIPMCNIVNAEMGSPIKLYDYLALGMPILSTNIVNFEKELTGKYSKLIYQYDNFDIDSLVNSMLYFTDSKIDWMKLHRLAKYANKNNSWQKRMELLMRHINRNNKNL